MKLLKDHKGEPSYTATMAMVGFAIVSIAIIIGIIEKISVGGIELSFRMIDAGVIAAFLTPVLGVYGWRRHDAKRDRKDKEGDNEGK